MLGGPDRRTLFTCTTEWHPADDHVANLERLTTGPRTGEIPTLPVEVPGASRHAPGASRSTESQGCALTPSQE
jgi:hypothetical protein